MVNNSIFLNISDQRFRRYVTSLKMISDEIPILISLKPKERIALQSISDVRFSYVLKCVDYCKSNRAKVGLSVEDLQEMIATARLRAQLRELLHLAEQLAESLRHTDMNVGANLYRMCRDAHTMMRLAHGKGRPGLEPILADLGQLYKGQGRSKKSDLPENPLEPTDE